MSEPKIERRGNRVIIRSQGMGAYENGTLIEALPHCGEATVKRVKFNHRTVSGDGYVSHGGEITLPIDEWLTVVNELMSLFLGGDDGSDRGVGESGSNTREPVPDAIPARAGAIRRPA
jgi:hypothetical protein